MKSPYGPARGFTVRARSPLSVRLFLCAAASLLPAALIGCGAGAAAKPSATALVLHGHVHGGQQPVSNALIQLWAAGQTGNGLAPTELVPAGEYYPGGAPGCVPSADQTCNTGVYSDASGGFTLTGDYTCPSSTAQVYLTGTGGNPGLGAGSGGATPNNPALFLFDALGSCGDLTSSTEISMNEVTTAAAAWALSPFMDANGNVGGSATNTVGIANAFLNAQLLADPSTGAPANIGSNLSVETGKLYALANALAGCVNSDGTVGCSPLFSAATVGSNAAPTTTMAAALNIVRNPANNVADVFYSAAPQPPFFSSLEQPPHDWTMSLTVTGGGINYPSAIDVDGFGNVWVANYFGVLSGFSPQGAPFNANGFNISDGDEVYGLTIDTSNNIWVTNEEQPYHGNSGSVTALYGAASGAAMGTYVNGVQFLYGNDTDFPEAMSADSNGDVLVANYGNSSASVFNSSGVDIMDGIGGNGDSAFPVSLMADAAHGIWIANQGDNTVSHVDVNGNLLARVACCDGANGIATDAFGNAWVANYYGRSVSEVSNANAIVIKGDTQGGIAYPSSLVIDAAQNVWVANFRGASFSEIAGNANALPAGTGISPSTGYGLDANLVDPFGITLDPSGDIWLSNFNANTLTMFFGLATPTATPIMPTPTAP